MCSQEAGSTSGRPDPGARFVSAAIAADTNPRHAEESAGQQVGMPGIFPLSTPPLT